MRKSLMAAIAASISLLSACGHHHHASTAATAGHHTGMHHGIGPSASASMEPTRGHTARGTVIFHAQSDGVLMHARISGLNPNQAHGFHIHEKGDCSSGDGMSTGGHFNPTNHPHGARHEAHHAGDLPALQADAAGQADLRVVLKGLSIGSGATDIVGRGLIVHAQPDDYKTQPTGNSGARIACAVITGIR